MYRLIDLFLIVTVTVDQKDYAEVLLVSPNLLQDFPSVFLSELYIGFYGAPCLLSAVLHISATCFLQI